jgi:beta-hydroxylase
MARLDDLRWAGAGLALRATEAAIRGCTRDGRRVYFDPAAFPWTATLETGWRDMRAELDAILRERERIPAFEDISPEQRTITDDGRWKAFVLRVFGAPVAANCARAPRTCALLQAVPGLCNAMFSILAPGKRIPPHRGPYNGLLRYHLALKVPAARERCSILVGGAPAHWEEGRSLIFDDSFEHSVANDTGEERVVLFADFARPLRGPLAPLNGGMLALLGRTPLARHARARLEIDG